MLAVISDVHGNLTGLNARQIRDLTRTYRRRIPAGYTITPELARHLAAVSSEVGRQVGVLAAACLLSLHEMTKRLGEDHQRARALAEGLSKIPGISLDGEAGETNILIFGLEGMGSGAFLEKLKAHGVLGGPRSETRVRFVTHRGITADDVDRTLDAVKKVLA